MNSNKDIYITSDEYEKLQGTFKYKTEYDNGKIIMHSDTSIKHNDIVLNVAVALKKYFKGGKCKVSTEQIEVIFDENIKYKLKVLQAWVEIHKDELQANWKVYQEEGTWFKIDPIGRI